MTATNTPGYNGFKLYRNSKTSVNHINTPGYRTVWCGPDVYNWLTWTDRGYVSGDWINRAIDNKSNRICKRCTSIWRNT